MTPDDALQLARRLHSGQPDVYGHVARVAKIAKRYQDPDTEVAAALHDTIEHGRASLLALSDHGVSDRALGAIQLVNNSNGMKYPRYIKRIIKSGNVPAMEVKIADLEDHLLRHDGDEKKYKKRQKAYDKLCKGRDKVAEVTGDPSQAL